MLQFSPYALPTYVGMVISIWLAFEIWSRRPGRGIVPFVAMSIGVTLWALGSGSKLIVTTLDLMAICDHVTYLGVTLVPMSWFLFVLDYTGHEGWITRRKVFLLALHPILVQIVIATNEIHHGFWVARNLAMDGSLIVSNFPYGPLFWVHAAYSYSLLLVSAYIIIKAFMGAPDFYKGQVKYLLLAIFTPWVANAITILNIGPLPKYVDITPLSFTIAVAAVAWSLHRYRLMDIAPVAREAIFDSMDDGVVVLDKIGRIVDANQAALQLIGRDSSEIIGKQAGEVFASRGELVNLFRNQEQLEQEIELGIAGEIRYFTLRISALYDQRKELTGRILVAHDITSLKKTNQELSIARERAEESTRLKSEFLATMSHELRTPLNAIIGYTEIQLAGITGELSDTQYEYGERILVNAKHLLALINDVLDLSKIEAGRMDLIQQPFEVRKWIDGIVRESAALAEQKNLTFEHAVDALLPQVITGDADRLRQVVVNLLSNAVKFTHKGSISLNVRQNSPDTWSIIVTDTGIGIPPHQQETIFDEFRQVDNSSTREYGGTGLGLAIVRKLVLAMGGTVRVNSTLDEGSTFTITLPLVNMPISRNLTL